MDIRFLQNIVESKNQYYNIGVPYNRIQNNPTALQFLKMFESGNILNQSFIDRVL